MKSKTFTGSIIPVIKGEEIEFLGEFGRGNNQVRLAHWRGISSMHIDCSYHDSRRGQGLGW